MSQSPCASNPCSHICIPKSRIKFDCKCSQGYEYADGKCKCKLVEKKKQKVFNTLCFLHSC